MIKTVIENMADGIGFDIGASDDVTQAKLLNGFCRGLNNSMDNHKLETQLCYIVDHLDDKTCKVLKELMEFINLKESK